MGDTLSSKKFDDPDKTYQKYKMIPKEKLSTLFDSITQNL